MTYSSAKPQRLGRTTKVLLASGLAFLYFLAGAATARFVDQPDKWFHPDGIAVIAENLCNHDQFSIELGVPNAKRGPLYPMSLAVPCKATGIQPKTWATFVNSICHFATLCLLLFSSVFDQIRRKSIAIFAAIVVGLDPLVVVYAARTLLDPMLILLVTTVICSMHQLVRKPGLAAAVFSAFHGV